MVYTTVITMELSATSKREFFYNSDGIPQGCIDIEYDLIGNVERLGISSCLGEFCPAGIPEPVAADFPPANPVP